MQNYIDSIQLQISCVTAAVVDVGGGYFVSATPHVLMLSQADRVALHGPARLRLRVNQNYLVTTAAQADGGYGIEITGYAYGLHDRDEREIFSYQWHPTARSHVRTPHLHLGAGSLVGREELQRSHLPTGFVELQQVLRLLIEKIQVTPLRNDWDDVLH